MRKIGLLGFTALVGSLAFAVPALAQQTPPPAGAPTAEPELEEITVTGSRLVLQSGMQAPTPVTVVAVDALKDSTPQDFYQGLTQLPVFAGSSSPNTASFGTGGANVGGGFADLRGLGPNRTLILLNGRRVVGSSDFGSPDIALFPAPLIQRVDIVTGGASAAYGSDAVAGVVNFVLDTEFEGVKGEVQGGISSRGDMKNYKGNLVGGTSFSDGRGHIVAAAEYNNTEGLIACDRRWSCEDRWTLVNNGTVTTATATAANPLRIMAQNVNSSRMAIGGLIYAGQGVLSNISFGPGGVPQPFIPGTAFNTTTMIGGSGDNGGDYVTLTAPRSQYNAFTHLSFEFTDNFKGFIEGSLGHTHIVNPSFLSREAPASEDFTIFRDNAYLPASIRAIMTTNNIASFRMGRLDRDFKITDVKWRGGGAEPSPMTYTSDNDLRRMTTGFTYEFDNSWSIDANYSYGKNKVVATTYNNPILENVYLASDAVVDPSTGNIVCRIKLQNPTSTNPLISGCIPVNLFGNGSPSQASMNYFVGTAVAQRVNKQHAAELTFRGELFEGWAGPINAAFGGTYRKENLDQDADPISKKIGGPRLSTAVPSGLTGRFGGFRLTNTPRLTGEYDIKEVFGEVLVPLVADQSWATALDFNAAARYADYSTSGGVETWKAGLVYEPIDGLRLRGTRSRDIRAGNMLELFETGLGRALTVNDPFRGGAVSSSGQTISRGDPNLSPEKADTLTLGVTYAPEWAPGLTTSVDWYDIDIKDAIVNLGAQNIVDQCFAGSTFLCALITRDASGQINFIDDIRVNASSAKASGVDFELNYGTPLDVFSSGWEGSIVLRGLLTYIDTRTTETVGAPPRDTAGQIATTSHPRWKGQLTARYENGPLAMTVTQRYIGSGLMDNSPAALNPANISPADNHISAAWYTNLSGRYKLGEAENLEVFLTVNNLFDKNPPPKGTFSTAGAINISKDLYDYVGRTFTTGVRFKF